MTAQLSFLICKPLSLSCPIPILQPILQTSRLRTCMETTTFTRPSGPPLPEDSPSLIYRIIFSNGFLTASLLPLASLQSAHTPARGILFKLSGRGKPLAENPLLLPVSLRVKARGDPLAPGGLAGRVSPPPQVLCAPAMLLLKSAKHLPF